SRQRLRLGQAEADLEAKRDEIELKLRQAVASFESTRKSYEFFNSAIIPESELALRAAREAYETGKVDILTLIAAQRALRQVQLSAIRLWGRAARRLAEIEEITGEDLI
ncbi:MAG TPA: TolC family protein, partial [Firmicutes bacterium]|nr:TolC family protein [Bacillota bacterium]